jgi:hypothetical protein
MKDEPDFGNRQWTVVLAVDQLNQARDLMDDSEKVELARLNLVAADEVISTSAFKMAEGFLETGIELLGINRWRKQYELTLELSNKLAFVLFSNGSMESSLSLIGQIYQQSKCDEDRHEVQFLHVEVLASLNRLSECIDTSMKILSQMGHPKLPKNPGLVHIISGIAGVKKLLKNKTDADLLSLPVCHDKRILSIIRHRKCVLQWIVARQRHPHLGIASFVTSWIFISHCLCRQQTDTGPSVDLSHDAIITSVWIERIYSLRIWLLWIWTDGDGKLRRGFSLRRTRSPTDAAPWRRCEDSCHGIWASQSFENSDSGHDGTYIACISRCVCPWRPYICWPSCCDALRWKARRWIQP